MEEKICSNHTEDVISACFVEGCDQHFLCKECIKYHPDNHNSQVKSILSLMRKDDWIKPSEEQRDSQITKITGYNEAKTRLFEDNKKIIEGMAGEIVEDLKERLCEWISELDSLSSFQNNPKAQEKFTKAGVSLKCLQSINFREGDVYDKVDKAKLFNENTLPDSKELCKQLQDKIDEVKFDETKIESCKQEILELIKGIQLKELFILSDSKRQKASEKLKALQQEKEALTQDKTRLSGDIEGLKTTINDLQAQLTFMTEQYGQLIESNTNYTQRTSEQLSSLQQELESLTQEKIRLRGEIEHFQTINNDLQAQLSSKVEQYDHLVESNNNYTQRTSEQLSSLQQENQSLAQEKIRLSESIDQFKTSNDDLKIQMNSRKEQNDQLTELSNNYRLSIESLSRTNEELQNQLLTLRTELDSVIVSKLKLHTDLEALNIVHHNIIEKFPKAGLLSEDSLIISKKHIDSIRNWIPIPSNLNESDRSKLNLVYRGTRDGFTSAAFKNKCKDKAPTMTFIKSKEHGRVFGGYTSKNWDQNNKYIEDKEAFLFSLTHGEKYPIKTPQTAFVGGPGYILAFGSGNDIYILEGCDTQSNKTYSNFPYSYQCSKFTDSNSIGAREYLAGSYNFTVEEIELYQVVWS